MLLNSRAHRIKNLIPMNHNALRFLAYDASSAAHQHNPMNPELYTENAYLSITRLPQYADKYKTQHIEATHILKSILEEGPTGLAQRALTKAGINTASLNE
jgi:hypothetical protein